MDAPANRDFLTSKIHLQALGIGIQTSYSEFQGAENDFQDAGNDFRGAKNEFQGAKNEFEGARNELQGAKNEFQGAAQCPSSGGLASLLGPSTRVTARAQRGAWR